MSPSWRSLSRSDPAGVVDVRGELDEPGAVQHDNHLLQDDAHRVAGGLQRRRHESPVGGRDESSVGVRDESSVGLRDDSSVCGCWINGNSVGE